MPPKAAWSEEQTINYLLSVIKSCITFDPDFVQVAGEFGIRTSRPGVDALVASQSLLPLLQDPSYPHPTKSTAFKLSVFCTRSGAMKWRLVLRPQRRTSSNAQFSFCNIRKCTTIRRVLWKVVVNSKAQRACEHRRLLVCAFPWKTVFPAIPGSCYSITLNKLHNTSCLLLGSPSRCLLFEASCQLIINTFSKYRPLCL
jgi:hypothetical protein